MYEDLSDTASNWNSGWNLLKLRYFHKHLISNCRQIGIVLHSIFIPHFFSAPYTYMYFGKRVIEGENNAMKTPRHPEGGLSHILSAGTRGGGGRCCVYKSSFKPSPYFRPEKVIFSINTSSGQSEKSIIFFWQEQSRIATDKPIKTPRSTHNPYFAFIIWNLQIDHPRRQKSSRSKSRKQNLR